MHRADRLFRITQELETEDYLTAQTLAQRLEVSQRTIYRDIDDLSAQRKVRIAYRRVDGVSSERVLWPLGLFYWGQKWTLGAWCELRGAFRHFRLDRIESLVMTGSRYESAAGRTLHDFLVDVGADSA
ncbi:MAG: WYL domain-containing protein [Candidatus Thiodiazotropha sp. (ex Rostrolucina anterorostrata)]|nr:WYL domain-containing protein [Candidatus Thiodiazotropha sp. (ex Rostrolucina anterorostrata)]